MGAGGPGTPPTLGKSWAARATAGGAAGPDGWAAWIRSSALISGTAGRGRYGPFNRHGPRFDVRWGSHDPTLIKCAKSPRNDTVWSHQAFSGMRKQELCKARPSPRLGGQGGGGSHEGSAGTSGDQMKLRGRLAGSCVRAAGPVVTVSRRRRDLRRREGDTWAPGHMAGGIPPSPRVWSPSPPGACHPSRPPRGGKHTASHCEVWVFKD